MLRTPRLIQVGCLLSLLMVACGGSSGNQPDNGPDAASTFDSGSSAHPDGSMGSTGDDGSTPTPDLDGATAPDVGTTPDGGTVPDGGVTPDGGATPDGGGTPDGGTGTTANGAACAMDGDCQAGNCIGNICCASDCSTPGTCQTTTGATCAGGATCVYPTAADSTACDDGNACTTGDTCHSGGCVGGAAPSCDDGNPCTDDSCDTLLGCKHQNNTATCSDGNGCTVGDVCSGGLCQSGPAMDCSSFSDQCNTGVCVGGACGKSALADSTPCNDGNACTSTDVCITGACTGSGNSCGPNASACAAGTPVTCTCNTGYLSSAGQCVPDNNECDLSPCVAGATCFDPSTTSGDVQCTCPTGFYGNGKVSGTGCTETDNCVGNPCGDGLGTCVNGINTHTCSCNAGYVSVGGACVCDMNGTFASQISFTTSWSGVASFEDGTNVPTTQWALRKQSYDSSGNLVIETTQCGGTTFDLCETSPLIGVAAFAQYLPGPIYDQTSMPVTTVNMPAYTAPLPGATYTEPQSATLLGISLTNPTGAWPGTAAGIGPGSGQVNGAIWVDNDNDSLVGVTSYAVPPGGISSTTPPDPLQSYGATSTACPRSNAGPRDSYNYLPGIDSGGLERIKRVYTASRVLSTMSGKITTCGGSGVSLIQGSVTGPDSGQAELDGRIGGCVEVSSGPSGEAACSSGLANFLDTQKQTEHVTSGSFIVKRIATGATCSDVRGTTFP